MKLLQPKVKIDEIHEIHPLSYEFENGLGREIMKLTLDKYGHLNILPKTFDSNGKEIFIGSNSYSKPMLHNSITELVKDGNLFLINPQYSEIGLRNYLLTREMGKEDHPGILFDKNGKVILVKGSLDSPRKTYEDLAFGVVYPEEEINPKLWKGIREQVQADSKYKNNVDINLPFIVLWPLDFEQDENYENGVKVVFNKDGLTQVYNVPILAEANGRDLDFDENDFGLLETGFPNRLGKGNRTLSTAKGGVFGFFRNWDLDLYAYIPFLAFSNDTGRVHVARKISGNNLEVKVSSF